MLHVKPLALLICLSLAACQQAKEGTHIVRNEAERTVDVGSKAIKRALVVKPDVEEYREIPYAFCYRVMQDINCYNQPIPSARSRLVGWQGRSGKFIKKTGYAETPPPSVKEELVALQDSMGDEGDATHVKDASGTAKTTSAGDGSEEHKATASTKKGAIKPLKPVFVGNPPQIKEQDVKVKITESTSKVLY